MIRLKGLDHVQLAMPAGEEETARQFYSGLLGLTEVPKPAELAGRGGAWFAGPGFQVHLGVEPGFQPARKAHPAFRVADLVAARAALEQAGVGVVIDPATPDQPRFHIHDPFGNRIELIQDGHGFAQPPTLEPALNQSIVHIALVVRDYDEAIAFYTEKLHFTLVEDTYQPEQDKRWVVIAPPGPAGTTLLLAKASKPEQEPFIGNQTGGRVFLFLNTDNFWRDYNEMVARGIHFVRPPKEQAYGLVAVFEDLYGNLWDLLQLNPDHPIARRSGVSHSSPGPDNLPDR